MFDEAFVVSRRPNAVCHWAPPCKGADDAHDRDGHYAVWAGPALGYALLGRGDSPKAAWEAAASHVRNVVN